MAYEKKDRKSGSDRRDRKDGDRPYKPRGDFKGKPRGDRPKRDFGDRPKKDFGDRPRKSFGDKPKKDFGDRPKRTYGDRPKRDFGDRRPRRDGDKRDSGFKPRGDFKGKPHGDHHKGRGDRKIDRGERVERREEQPETRRLILPSDASRLLYRGIDCQINGNNNLAMIMFLHGSVMMSEGCENNAERILKDIRKDSWGPMRTDIAPNCSEEALVEFDYLCIRNSNSYSRENFDSEYEKGNTQAIYRRICMEEVEGDDPIIDEFASRYPDNEKKVVSGLDILRRKKDSEIAAAHLQRIDAAVKLKQSIYVMFTRAMNGDARAVRELKENSKKVPEAAFFSEYLSARAEGNNVEWLRSKYPQYSDLIISRQGEFKIQDTPFGMYLKAKNLESKKEEYMSVMMNAAKAGSPEAMDELSAKMFRNDVRKCLASIHLKNNDLPNLLIVYQAGLDDMYYLDQYCGADPDRIEEVGKELGKQSIGKEIDWLKDHYDKGMEFCRDILVDRSKDEFYHNKKMIYALHDIGADMEAAILYFDMEDNPEVPSVKWLKKVCTSDDVTDFVRGHYEDKGQNDVFESIFADDGYEKRPKKRQGFGKKPMGRRKYRD